MVCSTSVFVSAEVYKSGTRELSGFIWFEGPATSVANACRKIFAMQARSLPRNSLDEVIRFCLSTYATGVIHVSDHSLLSFGLVINVTLPSVNSQPQFYWLCTSDKDCKALD